MFSKLGPPRLYLSRLLTYIILLFCSNELVLARQPPDSSAGIYRSRELSEARPVFGLGEQRVYSSRFSSQWTLPLLLLECLAIGLIFYGRQQGRQVSKRVGWAALVTGLFTMVCLYLLAAFSLVGRTLGTDSAPSTVETHAAQVTLSADVDIGQNVIPNIIDPQAVNAQSVCPGYIASDVQTSKTSLTANLNLAGRPCNVYGNDVESLSLLVEYQADDRLHVQIQPRYIGPANETWFILPEAMIPKPGVDANASESSSEIELSWSNEPSFSFTVKRKATNDTLFTTAGSVLVYEDQFIEFVSPLPENYNLYGLGEVIHGFRLGNNLTRTLFNADVGDVIDANIYGSHAIYHDTRYFTEDGSYVADATDTSVSYISYTHGVFLRNAHAQEILLQPSGITWRTLGGSIDLYFYAGPKAEDVTRSYQVSMVGLPAMQQYWTLGFHQCRWGYTNWSVVEGVVDSFAKAGIPLETMWVDIDYMDAYKDYTVDPVRFGYEEGARFLARLHANNQHFVPIVDSAIYFPNPENASDAYPTFDRGVSANAFMLNPDGSLYVGSVWPGYTVFPDWVGAVLNGTGTFDWWKGEMSMWHEQLQFDGIWIDMSEVSSFCVGSCGSKNVTLNPVHPPFELPGEPGNLIVNYPEGFDKTNATEAASASSAAYTQNHPPTAAAASSSTSTESYYRTTPTPGVRNINWPPYSINNFAGDLAVHAVSPNATHHGGYLEYDFHNLFGHQILNATHNALLSVFPGKRPFIIGRSTFAGSGKWAGHWGGDNYSEWLYMFLAIPQALSNAIFGIPMFGPDTCGFSGNTDMELCSRWMQLSAFFPFYRNHNVLGAISQEPYRWAAVAEATRTAMSIRFQLLPYMYTLLARAHQRGDTVMRALTWEFPNEPWLADADRQFMLGEAVMITPVLEQGASTVSGVFPGAREKTVWYDWYSQTRVATTQPGQNVSIDAPLGHIPVYLRGGNVLAVQEPAMTTTESRQKPWGVLAAMDGQQQHAAGELYLDDGESINPATSSWISLAADNSSVRASVRGTYQDQSPLANITVMGLATAPRSMKLNGEMLDASYWTYTAEKSLLVVSGLETKFREGAFQKSWSLLWSH